MGSFLLEVNIGIRGAIPTPLAILKWNTTIDDGMPSWACPAVSPHSAGVACPVSLYGEKARNPPTRAERGQELPIRRRSHATGSGPNYRRSRRRTRRRNPQPVAQTRAIFKRPRRLRRLGDWAFPTPNHATSATVADDDNELPHKRDGSYDDDRDDDDDKEMAEIKGRLHGLAEEFDNGGEIAEVKRGQDSLTEEGLLLRNEITSTTPPCRRIT